MPNYQELKDELENVSDLIQKYPDELKSKVFDLLMHEFYDGNVPNTHHEVSAKDFKQRTKSTNDNKGESASKKSTHKDSTPSGKISFSEFSKKCNDYKSSLKRNLLIIYHHEMILQKGPIKEEDIKSQYSKMGWKAPKRFHQSLLDAKSKNGWVYQVDENDDEHETQGWLTTIQGADFVKENLLNN